MQLTWTRLPQGFKNSRTLFSEALASDLASIPREQVNCTLLQYVDDLFIACLRRKACHRATIALLQHLATKGSRVSWKKAQLCRQEVKYLGFIITQGKRALSAERKAVITNLPRPTTR